LTAKINEQNTLKKRKELIASLSHDIKTPVASIKATTELLALQEDNESKRKKMMIIMDKAEQINLLASNLLQSTLDELEEMEVIVREECSEVVTDIIRSADYKNYIREISIPSCIIKIDKNRLLQVFDNIINNSYKYANTEIVVSSCFFDQYLRISVSDFGDCIEEDEIHLVDQRFYRGKKAKDFAGSGLGLYICKKIIDKIGGRIRFDKIENQFCVTIDLPLA
jgi:histidine kinase